MNSKVELLTPVDPSVRGIAEYARRVEEAGWDGVSIYDSQNITSDTYVSMTLAAIATERIEVCSDVTNPLTRHPAVTAGAVASLQQLSSGRVVLGIGRGDSALAHVGHAPVYTNFFENYLKALRAYLSGGSVAFDDLTFGRGMAPQVDTLKLAEAPVDSRLTWLNPGDKKVPVAVAASGPRVIGAAARQADIVMFALGADINRLKWGLEEARKARSDAGLDPDGIRYGAYVNVVCHPEVQVAREIVYFLDGFMRFSIMHGKMSGPMSRDDQDVLSKIQTSYNVGEHRIKGSLPADFVDRFAIVGAPDVCIERLRQIVDLGIDRIAVFGPSVDEVEGEKKLAAGLMIKEVLPAFSG